MKPYQVKLRIFGVLSLILAVLVASIPLPSRAASIEALEALKLHFTHTQTTVDTNKYKVVLNSFGNDANADGVIVRGRLSDSTNTYDIILGSNHVFENAYNLKTITIYESALSKLDTLEGLFKGCTSLETVTIMEGDGASTDPYNTTSVTSLAGMFDGCSSLTSVTGLGVLDIDNVASMENMFRGCSKLTTVDLTGWNTGAVTNTKNMFAGCNSLTDITGIGAWDVSKVTDMSGMFDGCAALTTLDLTDGAATSPTPWSTSSLTNMQYMFRGCAALTGITGIDKLKTELVTDMSGTFAGCASLTSIDLSAWNTANVTTMEEMFDGCSKLTDVKTADSSAATPVSWNTEKVTTMARMFRNCAEMTAIHLSGFVTPVLTDVTEMFLGCAKAETIDLSKMNFANVVSASGTNPGQAANLFTGCGALKTLESPVGTKGTLSVALPARFKYTPPASGGSAPSPVYTSILPNGTEGTDSSATRHLTRTCDVENLTFTIDKALAYVGDPVTLTITLEPLTAPNQEVTLTLGKDAAGNAIAEFDATQSHVAVDSADSSKAVVTLTNGTADVLLKAVHNSGKDASGAAVPVTITATIFPLWDETANAADTTAGTELTKTVQLAVADKEIKATGMTISEEQLTIDIGENADITATLTPTDATNHHVTWTSSDQDIAAVPDNGSGENDGTGTSSANPSKTTVTGVKPGTVRIEATSASGNHSAVCVVTVENPFDFQVVDGRTDGTSNVTQTSGTCTETPLLRNWRMNVATAAPTQTELQALDATGSYSDKRYYFTLSKTDGSTTAITDDFGDVTITMALHGDISSAATGGRTPVIMEYDTAGGWSRLPGPVGRSSLLDSSGNAMAEAITFTVDSVDLADKYAIVMETTSYTFGFTDLRNDKQGAPTVSFQMKDGAVQSSSVYLIIRDKEPSTVLKPRVDIDNTLNAMQTKKYYNIYTSSDPEGNNPVTQDATFNIRMALPNGMDYTKGTVRMIRENAAGNGIDTAFHYYLSTDSESKQYVEFTADHFSEYAILYDPGNSGGTSGGGSGSITPTVIVGARGPGNVTQVPSTNGLVVVASPNDGARFVGWQDGSGASLGTDLSMTVPQNATEVLAVFEPLAANNTSSSGTSSGNTTTSGSGTGTSGNTGTTTTDSSTTSGTTSSSTTTSGSGTGSSGSETGTSGSSGTGSTSNANNMPRTGSADMYRLIFVLLLVFSGTVEVLLSIPKKRRVRHA